MEGASASDAQGSSRWRAEGVTDLARMDHGNGHTWVHCCCCYYRVIMMRLSRCLLSDVVVGAGGCEGYRRESGEL